MSQSWSGRCGEEKNLASDEKRTQSVQHIACRYTDSYSLIFEHLRKMKDTPVRIWISGFDGKAIAVYTFDIAAPNTRSELFVTATTFLCF
jgi:hypothetical protein